MPLLREDKKQLAAQYLAMLQWATNAVLLKQDQIPVNEMNKIRMDVDGAQWEIKVVKKRVLLKWIEWTLDGVKEEDMQGSVMVLLSNNEEDQHAPLKIINKFRKQWKKDKAEFTLDYIGGWYERVWQDASYVGELASLPSKEELVSKFLFMLNHPVSSFARVIKAIAEKKEEGGQAVEESWETVEENNEKQKEEKTEEVKVEEVVEEAAPEEAPQEETTDDSSEEEQQE